MTAFANSDLSHFVNRVAAFFGSQRLCRADEVVLSRILQTTEKSGRPLRKVPILLGESPQQN